jgi:hypothetical protein
MTSLGIGTLRWGLVMLLPALLATQARAADAPPPPPSAGAAASTGAPAPSSTGAQAPADAPAGAGAAPSSAGAPADAAGAAGGSGDSGAYTVRLRGLEKNVNELKEQIFRTKARLNLLKETVLGGVIGASRALIRHKNEMGSSFRLVKAAFALDGVQIAAKSEGNLPELQEFDVYNGAIQPGSHTLSVALTYQGNGFGVFSYLKGYKFNVKSSHTFVAGESKSTNITVVGYEKGNITTQLSDKPAIDFRVNVMSAGESGAATAATKK